MLCLETIALTGRDTRHKPRQSIDHFSHNMQMIARLTSWQRCDVAESEMTMEQKADVKM